MMLCVMRVVLAAAVLAHVDALRVTRKDAIVGAAASSLRPVLPRTAKAAAAAATTASAAAIATAAAATTASAAAATGTAARLRAVTDPATYTALAYAPPGKKKPPLVVVLLALLERHPREGHGVRVVDADGRFRLRPGLSRRLGHGRRCHSTLSLSVVDSYSLGILHSSLAVMAVVAFEMAVSPRLAPPGSVDGH